MTRGNGRSVKSEMTAKPVHPAGAETIRHQPFDNGRLWLPCCPRCGAVIGDVFGHQRWHQEAES